MRGQRNLVLQLIGGAMLFLPMTLTFSMGPSQALATDAATLMNEGNQLRRQGSDEAAYEKFRQAYEMGAGARALAQEALAEQALGRWPSAYEHLHAALEAAGDPWIAKNRRTLEGSLTAIDEHLGRLQILGGPEGAELRIDGVARGKLPIAVPLVTTLGTVRIEIARQGEVSIERITRVTHEAVTQESFEAVASPSNTISDAKQVFAPRTGLAAAGLDVTSSEPAIVSVDGIDVGRSPVHVTDVSPGIHVVRAHFEGGEETVRKVRVQNGELATLAIDPPATRRFAAARKSLHPGAMVELGGIFLDDRRGAGLTLEFDMNLGISSTLDLRFGGRVTLAQTEDHRLIVFGGIPGSARLNLGSVFALGVGGFVGWRRAYGNAEIVHVMDPSSSGLTNIVLPSEQGLLAGPEVFPAILRLGDRRELELALETGALLVLTTSGKSAHDVFRFGVTVTYLFLGS